MTHVRDADMKLVIHRFRYSTYIAYENKNNAYENKNIKQLLNYMDKAHISITHLEFSS
jgi:hypothetical protein